MAHTFDGVNKLIILENDTTDLVIRELYSQWVNWVATGDNSKFLLAFRTVGGDPISVSKSLGITYFLINGWKIRPFEGNHTLSVEGNIYTDPAGSSPFVSTLGNFNVMITMTVSNINDTISADLPNVVNEFINHDNMQRLFAVNFGKCSGGGSNIIRFRDIEDTKDSIVATVDSNGNRLDVIRN